MALFKGDVHCVKSVCYKVCSVTHLLRTDSFAWSGAPFLPDSSLSAFRRSFARQGVLPFILSAGSFLLYVVKHNSKFKFESAIVYLTPLLPSFLGIPTAII